MVGSGKRLLFLGSANLVFLWLVDTSPKTIHQQNFLIIGTIVNAG
jgi:hypothetical protein